MRQLVGPAVALLVSLSVTGCYTLQPITTATIGVGSMVAFDITDAGRVAFGGAMGPEIAQIEGRVYQMERNEFEVAVTRVGLLRGGEQVWKGERIRVKSEYVSRSYERQFSRGRTVVAGAVGAGLVVFLVTRSILGDGIGDDAKVPGDTADSQRRPVRP